MIDDRVVRWCDRCRQAGGSVSWDVVNKINGDHAMEFAQVSKLEAIDLLKRNFVPLGSQFTNDAVVVAVAIASRYQSQGCCSCLSSRLFLFAESR